MAREVAFWSLFAHIKANGIAMTAPVELGYDASDRQTKERTMAFLYGDPAMGKMGRRGPAEVVDVPAMSVVSIGVRGEQTSEAMSGARQRLESWLDAHKAQYTASGPVMAYNSPFVPRERNFFEVQIQVKQAPPSAGKIAPH